MKIPKGSTFSNATEVLGERDYFVSAIDGDQYWLMAGPYATHKDALDNVEKVQRITQKHDNSGKAAFMGWGTCSQEKGSGRVGNLNKAGLI
jgi:hypothetical protein